MGVPRDRPYVWVTWVTKLMAGEIDCGWASWFRAHNTYRKLPSDFDVAAWTVEHTALVKRRQAELAEAGFEVYREGQNAFKLTGNTGIVLAGRPDLVAVRGDEATVVDCKTGTPKTSDQLQVVVYMIVLPVAHPRFAGMTLDGEVCYSDSSVPIPAVKVTRELRDRFKQTMRSIGGETPPDRVPSWTECRYCDIGPDDCPDRIDSPDADTSAAHHDLF